MPGTEKVRVVSFFARFLNLLFCKKMKAKAKNNSKHQQVLLNKKVLHTYFPSSLYSLLQAQIQCTTGSDTILQVQTLHYS